MANDNNEAPQWERQCREKHYDEGRLGNKCCELMLGWLMRGSGSAMKLIGLTWQRNPDLSFWDFKRDVQHVRLWKLQSVAFFQATPKVGPNGRHSLNAMHLLSGAFSFLTCVMVVSWIHTAMCCRIKVLGFFFTWFWESNGVSQKLKDCLFFVFWLFVFNLMYP